MLDNDVTFELSFGDGVVQADCEILLEDESLAVADCKLLMIIKMALSLV